MGLVAAAADVGDSVGQCFGLRVSSSPDVRAAAMTVAPAEANRSAVASPIPALAPVMTAILPSSSRMFLSSFFSW